MQIFRRLFHAAVLSLLAVAGCMASGDKEAELPTAAYAKAVIASGGVVANWSTPANGATISGPTTFNIVGEGMVNVELFRNGSMLVRATVAPDGRSASATLDTTTLPNGTLTLSAHAWNSPAGSTFTGEADTGPRTFTVSNVDPSQVVARWAAPAAGATLSGTVAFRIEGQAFQNVEIFRNGALLVRAAVAADRKSATASIDTKQFANGQVTLTAHAWNSPPGTQYTSDADAGPLTVTINNPTAAPWLSGSYGNGIEFGNWRGLPVAIVGMGYNNGPGVDNRGNITLDPAWSPPVELRVVESTYSLIDRSLGDTWLKAKEGALDDLWTRAMQRVYASWGSRKWFFIRPAHEFNGQELWDVRPGDEANFKAAWVRFYNIVQTELVQKGKPAFVVYNPGSEGWGMGVEVSDAVYPGDAFVDVIGVDYYDNGRSTDEASWNATMNATTASGNPHGLYTWQAFARRHGKPLALPEWGLQAGTVADNDNPFFIRKMNEFFRANAGSGPGQVLYEQYFTPWDSNRLHPPTLLPNSSAMYKSLPWSDGQGLAWPLR
jgi:hypothetical protein